METALETIVLKAVNKNPSDRYGSAKEMAEDLQRYLDDKPILAKRPGVWQRLRKWSRRHPSVVVAGVLLLLFSVVAFAVSTVVVTRAYTREKQRAEEAEQRFKLARQSADEMIAIAQDELVGDPYFHEVRSRLLQAALKYYQTFIRLREGEPASQAELAATRDRVKEILAELAVLEGAGKDFLLNEPSVLDDLELTSEQRGRIADLMDRLEAGRENLFEEIRRLTPKKRQARFLDMARFSDATLAKILTPTQRTRLDQIALQCQGALAFQNTDVAAELRLTPEQKRTLRTIATTGPFDRPGEPPASPGKRHAELRRMLAIFTEEQRAKWKEMIGSPFEKAEELFFPVPRRQFVPSPPRRSSSSRK